jgi:glycosyltransferase involved in cell wall biosynthesis
MLAEPFTYTTPRFITSAEAIDLVSVIVPVLEDGDEELTATYRAYRDALRQADGALEFIYVLRVGTPRARRALRLLQDTGEPLVIVALSRSDGEGAALRCGFERARGETIVTLPAYPEVEPKGLAAVLEALEECDFVVARRRSLVSSATRSLYLAVFHRLIRRLFGHSFGDLVCRVRACRRSVFEELVGYGTEHHFLPLLAAERGLRIREVDISPRYRAGTPSGSGGLMTRLRLGLDSLALFVVLKLIRKPLRFFGMIGLPLFLIGLVYTSALAFARLFFGVPLGDRPALILGVLLIVLGIQIVALGLIGEIIIFSSGKRIKDYIVEKVLCPGGPVEKRHRRAGDGPAGVDRARRLRTDGCHD